MARTRPSRKALEMDLAKGAGERLKWARQVNDLTQDEIAEACGISQPEWSRWERGIRPPDPAVLPEACNRLRISMDYIYRGLLVGVEPNLAVRLAKLHPEALILPPMYTGWHTDMDPA